MRLSLALRSLRSRGPFLIVECVLLAIGCTAALLSLSSARTALDSSLRCPHPDRTYFVGLLDEKGPVLEGRDKGLPHEVPGSLLLEWRAKHQFFAALAGLIDGPKSLVTGVPVPAPVWHVWVSKDMLSFLPQRMDGGRPFIESDFENGPINILVTHHFLEMTGLDLSCIGMTVKINGGTNPAQIIGILPATSRFPYRIQPDVIATAQSEALKQAVFTVIGELRPGIDPAFVDRELTNGLEGSSSELLGKRVTLVPIQAGLDSSQVRIARYGLLVGFLLLLLVLATGGFIELLDTTRKSKELSIKLALGANSTTLLVEKFVQVFVICGSALCLSIFMMIETWSGISRMWSTEWISAPRMDVLSVACVAGLLFLCCALAVAGPILIVRTIQPFNALKEIRTSASRTIGRARVAIVAIQIAACVGFVLTATKLKTELYVMASAPVGAATANVWGGTILVDDHQLVWNSAVFNARLQEIRADLAGMPGIADAGLASELPANDVHGQIVVDISRRGERPVVNPYYGFPVTEVGPNYLQLLNCRLVQGRYFNDRDFLAKQPPVILSEPMAHELFGEVIPTNPQVSFGGGEKDIRDVIGVVSGMRTFGISKPIAKELFEPMKTPWTYTALVIRESKPRTVSFREIEAVITKHIPGARLIDFQSLQDRFETELLVPRKRLHLLGAFSSIAAMVAIFGLCSVLFSVIKERDHEIGIRLALGAGSLEIARTLLQSMIPWVVAGTLTGVIASLFMSDPLQFEAGVPAWRIMIGQAETMVLLAALITASVWVPLRLAFRRPIADLLRAL